MHRSALRPLLITLPLGLLLTACGSDKTVGTSDDEAAGHGVPAGVVEQYAVLEKEIAERGGETTAGDYRVGYIVEAAEPWFQGEHGGHGALVNREPAEGETHHIEIIPMEAATGRIVPDVPVRLEVVDGTGKVVQAQDLNFYHATFFHYANNFSIPQDGTYTLRATLRPPTFLRHGARDEKPPLSAPVTVIFRNVPLKNGN
ncbi:iron transporter [Streptomyces sp. NPDC000410]|uniref:iron transporter n=1 Tax=Streptomyces sp. NPDC000410 TaxID=3154254 RepID=UPI00331AD3CB